MQAIAKWKLSSELKHVFLTLRCAFIKFITNFFVFFAMKLTLEFRKRFNLVVQQSLSHQLHLFFVAISYICQFVILWHLSFAYETEEHANEMRWLRNEMTLVMYENVCVFVCVSVCDCVCVRRKRVNFISARKFRNNVLPLTVDRSFPTKHKTGRNWDGMQMECRWNEDECTLYNIIVRARVCVYARYEELWPMKLHAAYYFHNFLVVYVVVVVVLVLV